MRGWLPSPTGCAGRPRPRTVVLEWTDPPFAPGHWVPEMVQQAGGECVLGRPGERSVPTTWADVAAAAPDVVVSAPCGFGLEDSARLAGELLATGSLPAAVPVWAVDANASFARPGPRLVDGIEALAGDPARRPGAGPPARPAAALSVTTPPARLERRLGLGDAVVIGLGSMLGAGVFAPSHRRPQRRAPACCSALAGAAVVAFCNAMSSARLAARYPDSGGTYVYGRRRLGDFWGFLAGWGFVVGKTASCAAMALTVGTYVWPAAAPAGGRRRGRRR